jgi:hypothetical protein
MPLKNFFKHKYLKLSYILDLKLQAKNYNKKKLELNRPSP